MIHYPGIKPEGSALEEKGKKHFSVWSYLETGLFVSPKWFFPEK